MLNKFKMAGKGYGKKKGRVKWRRGKGRKGLAPRETRKKAVLSQRTTARCGTLFRKLAPNPRATQ